MTFQNKFYLYKQNFDQWKKNYTNSMNMQEEELNKKKDCIIHAGNVVRIESKKKSRFDEQSKIAANGNKMLRKLQNSFSKEHHLL